MFEYLMPLLVMPSYDNTLLDYACKAAVQQQIAYGNKRGIPWGISESGYSRTDLHLNYQYRDICRAPAVTGFRNAPGNAALVAVSDLLLHGCFAGVIEQGVVVTRHHQQRH